MCVHVCANCNSIQIWKQSAESAGSFALDKTLEGHAGPVYALTVRAAGPATVLFSGSQDATAGIWSVPGGCRLCQLQQHKGPVNALALTKVRNWFEQRICCQLSICLCIGGA